VTILLITNNHEHRDSKLNTQLGL